MTSHGADAGVPAIDRHVLLALLDDGAQLAEVLPRLEYEEEHLPGAIHLPLKDLTADSARILDPTRPVVVYCWDGLCDMSPRAAWRLHRLGYRVYDYAAGKVDWLAAGLDTVRPASPRARVLDAIERDVATCSPDTPVAVLDTSSGGGSRFVVVNEQGIVLGRVRTKDLVGAASDATAEQIMEPGPATVRADADLEETRERMQSRHVAGILVTTPQGELLGALSAAEAT